jgi:hypothetical protein
MSDAIVHFNNETGLVTVPGLFVQFDDAADIRIPFVEGTGAKLRRYLISNTDIQDSLLVSGNYNVTVRLGDWEDLGDEGEIIDAFPFNWNGLSEIISNSGGGILFARIGIVSLTSQDFLEIIQGEQKVITFIVEAHGRFVTQSFGEIVVKIADAAGTVITKTEDDSAVVRVCEELDVQVLRCTLSEEDTALLVAGLTQIEIAFDNQKSRLTHSLKVIEQIIEEGS